MDMKKILAALDGVSKKPVQGASDMKKFVSIIKENSTPTREAVISSFEEDSIGGQANQFLIAADNINDMVMKEVEKVKINADPELLKDMMNKFNQFMTAYHSVGKEILQPDMFNDDVQVEGTAEELADIEKHPAADDPRIQKAIADKKKETEPKEEGIHNGLAFKDYFALEEAKKKFSANGILAESDVSTGNLQKMLEYTNLIGNYVNDPEAKGYVNELKSILKWYLSQDDKSNVEEAKKKGVDGKACWDGYRYAGKEKKADGSYKDKCVPVKKSK